MIKKKNKGILWEEKMAPVFAATLAKASAKGMCATSGKVSCEQ
jgi:hypothetical protein